jgi:DNA-binding FadR family transcriptional regulator
MPIQAIENHRLYRKIADQLGGMIESGEYKTGDRLPSERELAAQLRVSRSSVREAMIALEVEGCIEIRGGTGVFVVDQKKMRRPDTVNGASPGPFEILQVRRLIEPEAAALAAQNANEDQIAELQRALEGMSSEGFSQLTGLDDDGKFHLCVAEASGNGALAMTMQMLWEARVGRLYVKYEQHFHNPEIWQRAIDQHRKVLDAIVARDAKAARAAMLHHIRSAQSRFTSTWIDDPVALGQGDHRKVQDR